MTCGYNIYQGLYTYPVFPQLDWKSDAHLEPPVLLYPGEGQNICTEPFDQEGKEYLDASGCNLQWEAVDGATHYIVQWCNESSFAGPTLRSSQTTDTNYHLLYRRDIRMGESLYWRVMAHDGAGGISHKSEARSFKWDCPTGRKAEPKSSAGTNDGYCDLFNVTMELNGPGPRVHCCTRELFHLKLTYDCKDADGNDLITFGGTSWTVIQNPDDEGVVIGGSNNGSCIVDILCEETSQFWLLACANFTIVATGETFQCCKAEEVTIDCDTSYPGYLPGTGGKPWLKIDPRGMGESTFLYPDPAYRGTETAGYADPGSIAGKGIVGKGRIAVGPVIQTRHEVLTTAPREECKIDPGRPIYTAWEARVHLPERWTADDIYYGYGLTAFGNYLGVYYGCGLALDDVGRLYVDYGCGLVCDDGVLSVNYGDGLLCEDGELRVYYGDCLEFDAGKVQVNTDAECTFPIFSVDPGSVYLYTANARVYFQMSGTQYDFSKTECGLLLGSCDAADTWQVALDTFVGLSCHDCLEYYGLI